MEARSSFKLELLDSTNFTIKKGMVIVSKHDPGICCRKFIARFKLISHSTDELCVGFQGTGQPLFFILSLIKSNFVAFIGSLRRTVKIVGFDSDSIRLNQWANVTFEFYGGPEFVKIGTTLFFKERGTKGVGEILKIPESQLMLSKSI